MANKFRKKNIVIIIALYVLNLIWGNPLSLIWSKIILNQSVREANYLTEGVQGDKYRLDLIFKDTDSDMFYNPDSKEVILRARRQAFEYGTALLYKLDSRGNITDSISDAKSNMTGPDYIGWEDFYSTWPCTGDTTKYPIQFEIWEDFQDPVVLKLFEARYHEAKIADFWFDTKIDTATILMAMFGDGVSCQFIKMEIKRTLDMRIAIAYDDGTLERGAINFPTKSKLVKLKTAKMRRESYCANCPDNRVSLNIEHYTKHERIPFSLFSISTLFWQGGPEWLGTAYYKLRFNGDVLRFKSDVEQQYGTVGSNILFYYLDNPYTNNDSPMFMYMSENSSSVDSKGEYHHADIGLYLLRTSTH